MGGSLVGRIPSKENVAGLIKKSFMGKRESIWLAISFVIFVMINSHQFIDERLSAELDPIGNNIKLEGTRA